MPTATDLVTDLPADFEVFGQAVDTRLKALQPGTTLGDLAYSSATANTNTRLPVGTNGQVLGVVGGVPAWTTDASGMTNPMTTTGDTIYSSSGSTPARLGIGSTGEVLTVSGGVPAWATPAGSSLTLSQIASGTLTSGSSLSLTSLTSYDRLILRVSDVAWGTANGTLRFTINNSTSSVYDRVANYTQGFTTYNPSYFPAQQWDPGAINLALNGSAIKRDSYNNFFYLVLDNCKSTGFTSFDYMTTYEFDDAGTPRPGGMWGKGVFKSAAAVSSIQFLQAAGYTFSAGNYVLWGG